VEQRSDQAWQFSGGYTFKLPQEGKDILEIAGRFSPNGQGSYSIMLQIAGESERARQVDFGLRRLS
jgi:hypothetical protein